MAGNRLGPGTGAFRRAVAALFAGGFVTFAILHCTQPLMPIFSVRFGVSPATASLSLSATTATLAVSLLFAAAISGRRSRKAVMVASLLGSSSLALLLALSPNFASLLAVRALQGVVLAGLPSVAMAYVSEEFRPEGLGVAMGLYVGGTSLGGMAGRISAGVLADAFSWRVALTCVGIVGLLGALWFWAGLPAPSNSPLDPRGGAGEGLFGAFAGPLRDPGLVCVFGVGFLLMGSFMTLFNYVGYLLLGPPYGLSQAAVGLVFAAYLAGTFSSAWMGRLADRYGRPRVLRAGVAIMLVGASLTLVGDLYAVLAGIVAFVFGFFGAHSVASGLVGERAAAQSKAQASSLYLLFYYAGASVVGTASGLLWRPYGWPGVIISLTILLLLALAATAVLPALSKEPRPRRDPA
ncbi:MAG: MFS transporter [Rubrobacter sp.]|nr:MFS transporter [Rubrobacter sp.]